MESRWVMKASSLTDEGLTGLNRLKADMEACLTLSDLLWQERDCAIRVLAAIREFSNSKKNPKEKQRTTRCHLLAALEKNDESKYFLFFLPRKNRPGEILRIFLRNLESFNLEFKGEPIAIQRNEPVEIPKNDPEQIRLYPNSLHFVSVRALDHARNKVYPKKERVEVKTISLPKFYPYFHEKKDIDQSWSDYLNGNETKIPVGVTGDTSIHLVKKIYKAIKRPKEKFIVSSSLDAKKLLLETNKILGTLDSGLRQYFDLRQEILKYEENKDISVEKKDCSLKVKKLIGTFAKRHFEEVGNPGVKDHEDLIQGLHLVLERINESKWFWSSDRLGTILRNFLENRPKSIVGFVESAQKQISIDNAKKEKIIGSAFVDQSPVTSMPELPKDTKGFTEVVLALSGVLEDNAKDVREKYGIYGAYAELVNKTNKMISILSTGFGEFLKKESLSDFERLHAELVIEAIAEFKNIHGDAGDKNLRIIGDYEALIIYMRSIFNGNAGNFRPFSPEFRDIFKRALPPETPSLFKGNTVFSYENSHQAAIKRKLDQYNAKRRPRSTVVALEELKGSFPDEEVDPNRSVSSTVVTLKESKVSVPDKGVDPNRSVRSTFVALEKLKVPLSHQEVDPKPPVRPSVVDLKEAKVPHRKVAPKPPVRPTIVALKNRTPKLIVSNFKKSEAPKECSTFITLGELGSFVPHCQFKEYREYKVEQAKTQSNYDDNVFEMFKKELSNVTDVFGLDSIVSQYKELFLEAPGISQELIQSTIDEHRERISGKNTELSAQGVAPVRASQFPQTIFSTHTLSTGGGVSSSMGLNS